MVSETELGTAVEKIEYTSYHLNASGDMDTLADVLQRDGRELG